MYWADLHEQGRSRCHRRLDTTRGRRRLLVLMEAAMAAVAVLEWEMKDWKALSPTVTVQHVSHVENPGYTVTRRSLARGESESN
jgi:hypothetical protein